MNETITLKRGTPQFVAQGEIEVELKQLISEEIAAGPSEDYPAGSGVCAALVLSDGRGLPEEATLCQLSPPYESTLTAYHHGYRFRWVEARTTGNEASLALEVEKLGAEAMEDLGEVRLERRVPRQIDERLTVTLTDHSHKRTRVGQQSPLIVHLTYERRGREPQSERRERIFPRDPQRAAWYFERYRFEPLDYAYGDWMRLKVLRAR